MKHLLIAATALLLAACGSYSIRNIDKPAPRSFEGWIDKKGEKVDVLEAQRALLECGAPSINMTAIVYEKALGIEVSDSDARISHGFEVTACMEKAGFQRRWATQRESCKWYKHYSNFPACQPNATFADPSVERRLNSWHCRLKTSYAFCLENAINPAMCDKERDHRPPPPECQP
jgi:hypothetical protein